MIYLLANSSFKIPQGKKKKKNTYSGGQQAPLKVHILRFKKIPIVALTDCRYMLNPGKKHL